MKGKESKTTSKKLNACREGLVRKEVYMTEDTETQLRINSAFANTSLKDYIEAVLKADAEKGAKSRAKA